MKPSGLRGACYNKASINDDANGTHVKRIVLPFFLLTFCAGCAKLAHLQELLTLKAYSQDRDVQAEYVEGRDQQFEELLQYAKTNTFPDELNTSGQIAEAFGSPILSRETQHNGQPAVMWLYRYQVKYFHSEKVYFYFDPQGQLLDWNYVPAPEKPQQAKAVNEGETEESVP